MPNVTRSAGAFFIDISPTGRDARLRRPMDHPARQTMPAVAATAQWFAAEHARQAAAGRDDDMSAIVRALMAAAAVRPG